MAKEPKPKREPLPQQPVTLQLLSEYLDLSPSTISLVLNDSPGGCTIPPTTRERVRAAAAKFDYRPSFFARSLRTRQAYSVGVLVPELNDTYSSQVLAGVEEFLIEEGYFYLAASHHRKPGLIEEYPRLLMERSVEGFILIDTAPENCLKLPTVVVAGRREIAGAINVVLDQRRAAELTLRHLYQLGHRNIAFMREGSHNSDADDRWNCLQAVAAELEIPVRPELTVQLRSRDSMPESGLETVYDLLNRKVSFTALVCYSDITAIGATRALREAGLRVPEDISVVGFDDIQFAAFRHPSITTIRQPLYQMGITAARVLLHRIHGRTAPRRISPVLPELVIRESTGPSNDKYACSVPSGLFGSAG